MTVSDNKKVWYYVSGEEHFLMNDYNLVINHIKQNYVPSTEVELNNLILNLVNEINSEEHLVEHCMRQNLDPGSYMDPDLAYDILEGLEKELLGGF